MRNRDFIEENEAARLDLEALIASLDERSFDCAVGAGWTVSTLLCHLAFWDQRAAFLLTEWQRGQFDQALLSKQSVDSINNAVRIISQAVPSRAAARLALDSAAAVDSRLRGISDDLIDQIISTGFERYLRRSLHRREHLQKIKEALRAGPAGVA